MVMKKSGGLGWESCFPHGLGLLNLEFLLLRNVMGHFEPWAARGSKKTNSCGESTLKQVWKVSGLTTDSSSPCYQKWKSSN